jgi:hypothetical protein
VKIFICGWLNFEAPDFIKYIGKTVMLSSLPQRAFYIVLLSYTSHVLRSFIDFLVGELVPAS